MKTTIKILIPILVLLFIVIIVGATQKTVNDFKSSLALKSYDFKSVVHEVANDSISHSPLPKAREQYNAIYKTIIVESGITNTTHDGNSFPLLHSDTAQLCFETAFNSYWEVFGSWSYGVFNGSQWNSEDLDMIEKEVERLKNMHGTSDKINEMDKFIEYVKGYRTAVGAIYSAENCNSAEKYNHIVDCSKKYSLHPYNNCSRLKGIKDAPHAAIRAWENNVRKVINEICSRRYENYYDYKEHVNDPRDLIRSYRNATGNNSWGSELMNKIDEYEYDLKTSSKTTSYRTISTPISD